MSIIYIVYKEKDQSVVDHVSQIQCDDIYVYCIAQYFERENIDGWHLRSPYYIYSYTTKNH